MSFLPYICALLVTLPLAGLDVDTPDAGSRPSVVERAGRIDALVQAELARRGAEPTPEVDDDVFLRRTYLSIVGRIPSLDEQSRFRERDGFDRRSSLIDELLESPGHVSARSHYWGDLFRARTRLAKNTSGEPFLHWIKQALTENKPYDELVRELLMADGPAHQRNNGQTGFLLRDRGMPEESMSNTVRVFLGTRLECAQCHDHPFDRWSRGDYYKMVGFMGGIEYRSRLERTPTGEHLKEFARKVSGEHGRTGLKAFQRLVQPLDQGLSGSGTGAVRLPHDYQYGDGEPLEWVVAEPMFGEPVPLKVEPPEDSTLVRRRERVLERGGNVEKLDKKLAKELKKLYSQNIGARDAFAGWVTSTGNPRFTRVIVNRLWKQVMGRGLIEPVDDFKDDTVSAHPALFAHLEHLMVELDYDLRAFQAVLYNTTSWQREAVLPEGNTDEPHDLRGPVLRRMSAEELWDSILTLVVEDLDATLAPSLGSGAESVYRRFEDLVDADEAELWERVQLTMLRYTDKTRYTQLVREAKLRAKAEVQAQEAEVKTLVKALGKARRKGKGQEAARLAAELEDQGVLIEDLRRQRAFKGLQRASDLPSPAPDGHFLREFGQSDRDTIEAATTDPSVPQVLALMNGFLEERVLSNVEAHLAHLLLAAPDAESRVRLCFQAVLSREPSSGEFALWMPDVRQDFRRGTQDLLWTLFNSHEFLFVR